MQIMSRGRRRKKERAFLKKSAAKNFFELGNGG
jgi:hypothetical protein